MRVTKALVFGAMLAMVAMPFVVRAQDADLEDEMIVEDIEDELDAELEVDEGKDMHAHLLVHKQYLADETHDRLVQGRAFKVQYVIINLGAVAATEVQISDEWDEDIASVEGETTFNFETIAPGAREEVTVTLVPKGEGEFASSPASVQYNYKDEDGTIVEREATSSTLRTVLVLSEGAYQRATSYFILEWAVFAVGALLVTLWPYSAYSSK
mmetsp:Transcript_94001/g.130520  ORF Transcript_94001/g.130520 Transcript_94001/m.130520 type:complete len:212 (+) Transcript_94001:29-664(+)